MGDIAPEIKEEFKRRSDALLAWTDANPDATLDEVDEHLEKIAPSDWEWARYFRLWHIREIRRNAKNPEP